MCRKPGSIFIKRIFKFNEFQRKWELFNRQWTLKSMLTKNERWNNWHTHKPNTKSHKFGFNVLYSDSPIFNKNLYRLITLSHCGTSLFEWIEWSVLSIQYWLSYFHSLFHRIIVDVADGCWWVAQQDFTFFVSFVLFRSKVAALNTQPGICRYRHYYYNNKCIYCSTVTVVYSCLSCL